jgi:hypothetical protein
MAGRDLALDSAGDLDLAGGGHLVEGQAAIAQRLTIRLRTFLGEYFLDTTRGLPWLTWSESKMDAATLRQVKLLALSTVRTEDGVTGVDPAQVAATWDSETKRITVGVGGVRTDTGLLDEPVEVTI